jgi:hypothetical protein
MEIKYKFFFMLLVTGGFCYAQNALPDSNRSANATKLSIPKVLSPMPAKAMPKATIQSIPETVSAIPATAMPRTTHSIPATISAAPAVAMPRMINRNKQVTVADTAKSKNTGKP